MHQAATLHINTEALKSNYTLLKSKLNGRICSSVVKANAYGLGVQGVSKALWDAGCADFFVATLDEGIELRAILPDAQIYVFHGVMAGEEKEFLEYRLVPVLNDMSQVERWSPAGGASALHIDTGMTRLGLSEKDAATLAEYFSRYQGCNIQMVLSHLACAHDPNDPKNAEQLKRFQTAYKPFANAGIAASLSNSSGIFLSSDYHYDLARPGCALYGITPTPKTANPMQHVATLSAPIIQLREVSKEETVGYGATHKAKTGDKFATVALGYADGFFRMLGNKAHGYINGTRVPLVGRVSMDMVIMDVSALPALKVGDRVEFINAAQPVDIIADACGTIGYEIFTRIGERVKREYS